MTEEQDVQPVKRTVDRSPRYPSIPLSKAIDRAREFYRQEAKHAAKPEIAVTHWGYSSKSSGGRLTLAALRSFGLLENAGGGVKLSDRALHILLDEREDSPDRVAFIQQAALAPTIHRKLWDKFKADLPSQASLRHSLLMEFEFAPGAVDDFIREYRDTLAFAGLNNSALLVESEKAKGAPRRPFSVGDLVDWESQGVLQNQQPLRIVEFSEDGLYAFVDGSGTGLPVVELARAEEVKHGSAIHQDRPLKSPRPAVQATGTPVPPPAPGIRQDVFSLSEGQAVLRWPETLSPESFEDFKGWLQLVLRKVARSAGVKEGGSTT